MAKLILVIMQNMYSASGVDTQAPLIFKINPRNKSGKTMLKICDSETNRVYFSNTSSVCSGGGAESWHPTDLDYMKKVIDLHKWDCVLYCGNQAKEAYLKHFRDVLNCGVILMPHPASRSLTNNLKFVASKIVKTNSRVNLIQLKNKKVKIQIL